jgi:cephalosporin-C deacetylase-like acetyl esterase
MILKYIHFALFISYFNNSIVYAQTEASKRQDYLKELILLQEQPISFDEFVSYHDKTWHDWVKRTGELPPNFNALPSIPLLPDPLIIDEGDKNIPVKTLAQWKDKREYIKQQVKHIFSGTFPAPPKNFTVNVLEKRVENGVKIEMIELRFGENDQAKLTLELFTPPGKGPFPVFMTQWNHRGWAQIAVRRGYMGLIYAGADSKDDTRKYLELYRDYDWTTLMARAWGAHRAVDYLHTLNSVDKSKIAITGHSRNGKQSLLAAAFDDRITAVISSSGGTGGEFPYRYTDERHNNESIDFLASRRTHWLHPRLRFYSGREHKLPIDQNSLMALIAPNALLLSSSIREGGGGDPWAIEQLYNSLSKVYEFLNASEKLGIRLRDGEHGVSERDIEAFVDWLDIQFQSKKIPWENKLIYNYSFDKWKTLSNENIKLNDFPVNAANGNILRSDRGKKLKTVKDWNQKKADIKKQISWVIGDEPAGFSASPIQNLSSREDYVSSYIDRPQVKNGKKENIAPYNALGDYLYGSLYYPTDKNGEMIKKANSKIPVVIFIHKYSNTGYDSNLNFLFNDLLSRGIAVLAMDMVGYGARIEEGTNFYERYPNWSKLGKMITDTRAAIDALESIEFIDKDKIFLSGYALGGTVSLFTAALDNRIAGTAVSSAFTPLRDGNANKDNEGVKAYSHLYGLLPKLGFFIDNENRLPVDYTEIISSIAPRPLLVISPKLDRHANAGKVNQSMEEVASVYSFLNASKNLEFKAPHEFNEFTSSQQKDLVNWLDKMAGL